MGLLALAPRQAVAQDTLSEPQASEAFHWPRVLRNYAPAPAPGEINELKLYLSPEEDTDEPLPSRSFLRKAPPSASSRLILFTRLAGMFMGRVSPLSAGDWRLCLKIDIK